MARSLLFHSTGHIIEISLCYGCFASQSKRTHLIWGWPKKIRDVISTIISKVVLILGRFTKEQKKVLDALRNDIRNRNLLPVMFDFSPSTERDYAEIIMPLASMARFIIADITDAEAICVELQNIVPHFPSVPVKPILRKSSKIYLMFETVMMRNNVLDIHYYQDIDDLLTSISEKIIEPAEQKAKELAEELIRARKRISQHNSTRVPKK